MHRPKSKARQEKAQAKFIDLLTEGVTVKEAATACGLSRATLYRTRKSDAVFSQQWDDAFEAGTDSLEAEAQRRAMGYDVPVHWQGKQIGSVKAYSDTLLIFLLKARAPLKYCDKARAASYERKQSDAEAAEFAPGGMLMSIGEAIMKLHEEKAAGAQNHGVRAPLEN